MPTRSPTELILKNARPGEGTVGVAAMTWEARATFGPYLRGLREAARLNLRLAAEKLGLSFSYLAKLETGEKPSPPSLKLMQRMANLYGRDLRELMHEAGFRFETPHDLDKLEESLDARFLRLVMHPALCPMRMDAVVVELIPPLVKRQWIEFARKLELLVAGSTDQVDIVLNGHQTPPEPENAAHNPAPPKTKRATKGKPQ